MSLPRPSRLGAVVRGVCLLAAAAYAGLHLLLWLSVAPEGLVRIAVADGSAGERIQGSDTGSEPSGNPRRRTGPEEARGAGEGVQVFIAP